MHLEDLKKELILVIEEWIQEKNFLITNSCGSDIAVGNTYGECASRLKSVLDTVED